ncbi:hypothetical protein V5799_007014 [Amblyomma americanum]|uniref:Uncharacterized protein n=1 Tax=Amblyomma americanum TaxID=6943 RepID=A0AAQ4DUR5_AMBAM
MGVTVFRPHLDFNKTCREKDVLPVSLRLKRPVTTPEGLRLVSKPEQRLLCARIHERHSVRKKELDLFFTCRQLEHRMPKLFPCVQAFADESAAILANKRLTSGKKLVALQKSKQKPDPQSSGFIKNISSRHLTRHQSSVLAKGLGFNMSSVPGLPKLVAAVEDA